MFQHPSPGEQSPLTDLSKAAAKKGAKILALKLAVPALIGLLGATVLICIMMLPVFLISGGGPGDYSGRCETVTAASGGITVEGPNGDMELTGTQVDNALSIVAVLKEQGAADRAVLITLMTVMQESSLLMYANSTVPDSLDLDHDKVGSDHDSVGLFQQRPSSGWGEVRELMNIDYSVRAFLGGNDGPNKGNPPGLYDIDGWEQMGLGEAAQTVQVSAYPDAYDKWLTLAEDLYVYADGSIECDSNRNGGNGEISLPLKAPITHTDLYGPRNIGGNASTWHLGVDLHPQGRNSCDEPVYAVKGGTVTGSNYIMMWITDDEGTVFGYGHIWQNDRLFTTGDTVETGDQIGVIGDEGSATGQSFGCHLDFRVDPSRSGNDGLLSLETAAEAGNPNIGEGGYVDPVEYFEHMGLPLFGDAGN